MKKQKIQDCSMEQFQNAFEKIVENGKIDSSNTQKHDPLLTLLEHLGSLPVFYRVCVAYLFSFLCSVFFVCLLCFSSSCGFNVPNVVSVSGLSILECPFGFL